jgi:segregation and condensation protein A
MEKLSFRLPVFEGPLDALLYLISKNKLDIYDVSISELLEQYMAYLAAMSEMNLDMTSEFLEMASRLVEIKSAMLLPKTESTENKREEFIKTLIEYQTCKLMAGALRGQAVGLDRFVRQPQPLERDEEYQRKHKADEMRMAVLSLGGRIKSRRPPTSQAFQGVVGRPVVSVMSRIVHVVRRLIRGGAKHFNSMFDDATGRSEAIATFLALLELVKSKKIVIDDADTVHIRHE